jgi:outer membrane receptor protein involved in Fe transport
MAVTSVGPATARPVIRGLGGDRVLVLEDGARVGDLSSTSSDHALSVDPLNAQRIEVVRGPAALLYGSNAIGGVINVIRDEVPSALPDRRRAWQRAGADGERGCGGGGLRRSSAWAGLAVRGEGSYRTAGDLRRRRAAREHGPADVLAVGRRVARRGQRPRRRGVPILRQRVRHPRRLRRLASGGRRHRDAAPLAARRIAPEAGDSARSRLDVDAKYTNYYHRELEAPTSSAPSSAC